MEYPNRQRRLPEGQRRIVLNVNLSPEVHQELGRIGKGNRSKAIEALVREYLERQRLAPAAT